MKGTTYLYSSTLKFRVRVILREDPNGSEVLLGCHIQANLKWDKQVSAVIEKLNTRLTGLRTIQGIAPFHVKNMVIQGLCGT